MAAQQILVLFVQVRILVDQFVAASVRPPSMQKPAHPSSMQASPAPQAIILAAGKGTRMKSDLPKVVFPVGGEPMVRAVVRACLGAGCSRVVAVVGHKQELVREALGSFGSAVAFAVQEQQLGTGHAVASAAGLFARESRAPGHPVFVLCGDGPLIRTATLTALLDRHRRAGASATLATAVIDDPAGYGRVIRGADGRFAGIVEQKNATPEQLRVREVNPSYYCFDAAALFGALPSVTRNALTNEYYITDVPVMLQAGGGRVEVVEAVPAEDILSINTPEDLAKVDAIYRSRRVRASEKAGPIG